MVLVQYNYFYVSHNAKTQHNLLGLNLYIHQEYQSHRPIKNLDGNVIANCTNGSFQGKHMAVCAGAEIEKFSNFKIKKSFAPIAVVKNIKSNAESCVYDISSSKPILAALEDSELVK